MQVYNLNGHVCMITFDEYEPKPTLDTILSPYSRENETFFRFKVMESCARGTQFTKDVKYVKQIQKKPLMRLHVAKHIFSGEVLPSGGITAGKFGAKPHLKFKNFSQFSVEFKK